MFGFPISFRLCRQFKHVKASAVLLIHCSSMIIIQVNGWAVLYPRFRYFEMHSTYYLKCTRLGGVTKRMFALMEKIH